MHRERHLERHDGESRNDSHRHKQESLVRIPSALCNDPLLTKHSFNCSICKKLITTAQARLDRSQNWCRNCFHAIVYNVLYYPLAPPEWCKLRPISQKRMQDIATPKMKGLWVSHYEELRAMRGRPAGGMLVASLEEPPLLLYRNPAVKDEISGRTFRTGYFEITYFEEPFSSFVARRK